MARSPDLYVLDHETSNPEEARVYNVVYGSHSKPNAVWCTVCLKWFGKKEDKAVQFKLLVKHCNKAHYEKDGKICSRDTSKRPSISTSTVAQGAPVSSGSVAQTTPHASPANVMRNDTAHFMAIRPEPIKPPTAIRASPTPSASVCTPQVEERKSSPKSAPVPVAARASIIARSDTGPAPPSSCPTSQSNSKLSPVAPPPSTMEADNSNNVNEPMASGGDDTKPELPSILDPVIAPPTPPGYDEMIKGKNKKKERRKREYLILPVKGEVRQVAADAQHFLYESTGLLFLDTVIWAPADAEAAKVQQTGAIPDDCNMHMANGKGGDLYLKVWAKQQFFRAGIAALGYKFSTSRIRALPGITRVPPVEDWLEIRKELPPEESIVAPKKQKSATCGEDKNQPHSTQANPNAVTSGGESASSAGTSKATKHSPNIFRNHVNSPIGPVAMPAAALRASVASSHTAINETVNIVIGGEGELHRASQSTPRDSTKFGGTSNNASTASTSRRSRLRSELSGSRAARRSSSKKANSSEVIDLT